MKKVIIILSVILLTGCTTYSSNTLTMERAIGSVIESGPKYANTIMVIIFILMWI